MDDRTRFFDRPTRAEDVAARRARKAREDEDKHAKDVLDRKARRQAEIEREAREANPKGPWWPGS